MSNASFLARPGRLILLADSAWKSDTLPKDDILVVRDQLPDPDTDSLLTTGRPADSLIELERRWTELALHQSRIDHQQPPE